MKIRFYFDVWPGTNPGSNVFMASTVPYEKSPGVKRVAFDVTVPDVVFSSHDIVAPEVSPIEVVGD